MCVICTSPKGIPQPSAKLIREMFRANPDGAGYMFARNGEVEIRKGYTTVTSFLAAIKQEAFAADDAVVYHFRISTQAGKTPEMTHPFPLSEDLADMECLSCSASIGIAHNGIIRITSDGDRRYSDTAKFIVKYLVKVIRSTDDLRDPACMELIDALARSRFALMDGDGYIAYAGSGWSEDDSGLRFSNRNHEFTTQHVKAAVQKCSAGTNNYISKCNFQWPDAWNAEEYAPQRVENHEQGHKRKGLHNGEKHPSEPSDLTEYEGV